MIEKLQGILLKKFFSVWQFYPLVPVFMFGESLMASSGGVVHSINYYEILLHNLGFNVHDPATAEFVAVPGAIFISFLILVLGIKYKSYVDGKLLANDVAPDQKPGMMGFLDLACSFVYNLVRDQIGHGYKPFLPLILSIFLFILASNLVGLIPGFNAPTSLISMNVAIGLCTFLVYNYAGFKENGTAYLKHFTGPVLFLAPLFLIIELVGHFIRPYSLSLRLMGNLFGDHLVLAVFTGLTPILVPGLLMFFGLLVAFVQSYIFTLLSTIYISMAVSHDH